MKALIALAIAGTIAVASCKAADSYSMEATVTLHKETNQYEAAARVCKLVDRRTKQAEEVISRPKVVSTRGTPGSFYVGSGPSDPNYRKSENVTMDVTWPNEGERNIATCTIIVKRGDSVLAKSKMQVSVSEK